MRNHSKLTLFADDTNLLTLQNKESKIYEIVQEQLKCLNQWIEDNLLTINLNKTCYIIYHKTKKKNYWNPKNTGEANN